MKKFVTLNRERPDRGRHRLVRHRKELAKMDIKQDGYEAVNTCIEGNLGTDSLIREKKKEPAEKPR